MRLAIFDFDGTLLQGNSWHEFFVSEMQRRPLRAPVLIAGWLLRRTRFWSGSRLRAFALRGLRGLTVEQVAAIGENLHRKRLARRISADGLAELERRRKSGYGVVIATGAFAFSVTPFAHSVRADAVVATEVEFIDGRCSGRMLADETLGSAKAAALREKFDGQEIDWSASCAFTDSLLDTPLLRMVGEPHFVTKRATPPAGLPAGTRITSWDRA